VQSRDLGCVHERLGLGVGGRAAGKLHSESIRDPVGETVERIVVVIGWVSAGADDRGGDAVPHGSVS
jgi:hypothetical protein